MIVDTVDDARIEAGLKSKLQVYFESVGMDEESFVMSKMSRHWEVARGECSFLMHILLTTPGPQLSGDGGQPLPAGAKLKTTFLLLISWYWLFTQSFVCERDIGDAMALSTFPG